MLTYEHHPGGTGPPRGQSDKEATCQCRRFKRLKFNSSVGKIPEKKKWELTSVFLPGKFHEQRSLVGYSPWGRRRVGHDLVINTVIVRGFLHNSAGKESTCNAGDPGSIPGSGRSTGEGIGYLLQYSWATLVAQLVKNPPAMWEI